MTETLIAFGLIVAAFYPSSMEEFRKRKPKHDGSVVKRVGGYVEFIKVKK